MKVLSHPSRPSVSCAIGVLCAAVVVASAHTAQAGINVWTSHGPGMRRITALALDATAAGTLYAGTYDLQSDGVGGVYKSTDGGTSWSAANTGLETGYVSALALDPTTPGTLYAGTDGGVFKSTDGGNSWSAANTGLPETDPITTLAIDPTTPSTLYAAALYSGVFKSTDGGGTWSDANTGLPLSCNNIFSFSALAIDPTAPDTLYAVISHPNQSCDVYRGPAVRPAPSSAGAAGTMLSGPSGSVFKSTDGGGTWSAVASSPGGETVLAVDPTTPGTLYAGTDGGVFSIQQVAVCVGDCSGTSAVAVNDLITLVNIALDTAQPPACADGGLPLGGDVDVALIMQAVNNALHGCERT